MQNYIITGGPGSGKTTLLQALREKKYTCYDEASREVIKKQVSLESDCVPWKNLGCFARKVLRKMEEQLKIQAKNPAPIAFFDRGIPDIIAYLRYGGLEVEEMYFAALQQHNYHTTVFLAPPWEEIYVNDPERWQTFVEAKELHKIIKSTYQSLGFKLLLLPQACPEERVNFVVAAIEQKVKTI